jgi:MscS family membrane protein
MNVIRLLAFALFCALAPVPPAAAQDGAAPAPAVSAPSAASADDASRSGAPAPASNDTKLATAAAAAASLAPNAASGPRPPDFLEHMVDVVLALFDVKSSGNTPTHYIIAALFLVGSFLLRHVVTTILFGLLKRLASKTETTLDDKLFGALESPVATLISVAGAVAALKVLKLSQTSDVTVGYISTVAFSVVILWGLLKAFNALLDHAQEVALQKQMGIAAFMPWIKKTLVAIFVVFGVLLIAQSLGADVKAFLAGLGIGGLAFALAAQDTIANVFGSVVVAIDQPFKVGEYVRVGAFEGTVEDIGLRSTRLRTPTRTLVTVPNKTMASETITNISRMPQRRVDQTIGLTYDATPEQLETILGDLRTLLANEAGVETRSILVRFANFGASSLDIQMIYYTTNPDFSAHMELRERINLAIMRLVAARGLSMAFPTQTIQLDGAVAKQLAAKIAAS